METSQRYLSNWQHLKKEYKLTQVLGKGTYGMVVKAVDRKTKKEVAIKYIQGKLASNLKVRNLIRELAIMR